MWPPPKHNEGEVIHLLLNYEKKHGTAPAKNKYKLSKLRNNREKFILELYGKNILTIGINQGAK